MRELDVVLSGFLDARYAGLTESSQRAFQKLLDQNDPEIWSWLMGASEPGDEMLRDIVATIRDTSS
jgi:antitoxin CptB